MKKVYFLAALGALTLASCSNNDANELVAPSNQQAAQLQQTPVTFGAYVNRSVTRSGMTGDITNTELAKSIADGGGFGVFAYYTDMNEYDQSFLPNFMYNQGVEKSGDNWTYSPVKYWPNEYGSTAISDDMDKMSFFAYAPYCASAEAGSAKTVDTESGIIGFSRNSATGDPFVKFVSSFNPAKKVDLLWGVQKSSAAWTPIYGTFTAKPGLPWLNVLRPAASANPLEFEFNHALASLNVQIKKVTNVAGTDVTTDNDTRIYIRAIKFEGVSMKGALNLNNAKAGIPSWFALDCSSDIESGTEVTVYDGRKDGKEGAAAASSEKVTGLNENLIQNEPWASATHLGVPYTTEVNLFNSATATDGIYVIPSNDKLKITLIYDVETPDDNLSTYLSDGVTKGSSIQNVISKTICTDPSDESTAISMVGGKKYTVKLNVNLNSVDYSASVAAWGENTDATADLPANN